MRYISAHDDGHGWLKAAYGVWSPSIFDDKDLKRVTVATGHAASSAFPKMIDAVEALNASGLKYKMTEQNCNSATRFFLTWADIQAEAPSTMTGQFGWRKKLEKKINKPVPANPAMPLPQTATTTIATPVPQTVTTTTTVPVPQTVASTAIPLIPPQWPALPPLPGTVTTATETTATTTATTQAVAGATATTQTPPARQPLKPIRSEGRAKPRRQARPAPRGREVEELPTETHVLSVPVAIQGQNNSLPAGTRITVNKISYVANTADIGVLLGPRSVLVALTELEAAIGESLT